MSNPLLFVFVIVEHLKVSLGRLPYIAFAELKLFKCI